MLKNDIGLYTSFKAKDARFDGRFFVGISSTGIYCCRVPPLLIMQTGTCARFLCHGCHICVGAKGGADAGR